MNRVLSSWVCNLKNFTILISKNEMWIEIYISFKQLNMYNM